MGCAMGLVILLLIGPVFVWFGWNLSMPSIFGLREISIVEALGLVMLFTTLFKSATYTTQ